MLSKILLPHRALKKYIYHYVFCEIGSLGNWSQSNMAPPGYAKLVIVLHTDKILAKENGDQARNFPPITFVGQVTHHIPFSWFGQLKVFFVIFRPCGAFPLIGLPQDEFKNLPLNFSDVINFPAKRLKEQMTDIHQPEKLKEIIDRFFLQRISTDTKKQEDRKYQSLRLAGAVKKMHTFNPNGVTISEVCRRTGYSLSTLERRMKKIVGITPKQLQRIIRFNRVIQFINQSPSPPNWAQVARHFGYYDQTHFIKEFKHFSGTTPSKYLAENPHFLSEAAI